MNRRETMSAAARDAMIHVLDLVPEDRVLVVSDAETATCGEAFAAGARDHGCEIKTFDLPENNRPLQKMPPEMNTLLEDVTVVINAISGDCREIPFRLQWIHAIEVCGYIRMGHSPGIDEDMMVGGPLNVDYGEMLTTAENLIAGFEGAAAVHITTEAGTNLRLDVAERTFVHDLKATVEVGANLPCGEIYCAPVETGANGILVIDGCFACHGMVPSPVFISLSGGKAVEVTGDDDMTVGIINGLMETDAGARTIAELGIGLNPGARLTERMLEAEKAHRTAHVAFGSNEGFPGGMNHSTTHIDYLILKPSIEVVLAGGRARFVMKDGLPV